MNHLFRLFIITLALQPITAYSWNSVGHRVVAQIAYDHLTPHAKSTLNKYNRAMNKEYRPQSFVNAAVWLDGLRFNDVSWFNTLHYIDMYFSQDDTPLPATQPVNALWAIQEAKRSLTSMKTNSFDKGLSLRILIHVVGDIHQPLHVASRVSEKHPNGDKGGNFVKLGTNPIAANLHQYWDKGAGFLTQIARYNPTQIKEFACNLEKSNPCKLMEMDNNPEHWANESYTLAVQEAYLKSGSVPDKNYQSKVQKITKERIALAGCRLAATLNQIDANLTTKNKQKKSKY